MDLRHLSIRAWLARWPLVAVPRCVRPDECEEIVAAKAATTEKARS